MIPDAGTVAGDARGASIPRNMQAGKVGGESMST